MAKAKAKPTASRNSSPSKKAKPTRKTAAKKPIAQPLVSTGFWLMKSEPESYSIDALAQDGKTLWTGVRNYQARNFMMHSMNPGDKFLFYHSNAEPPGVFGIGKVVRPNCPDPSATDPKDEHRDPKATREMPIWFCAEVEFVSKFNNPVTLPQIRAEKSLAKMALLAPGQRLSVQPVRAEDFQKILELAKL